MVISIYLSLFLYPQLFPTGHMKEGVCTNLLKNSSLSYTPPLYIGSSTPSGYTPAFFDFLCFFWADSSSPSLSS